MTNIISRESVRRANYSLGRNSAQNIKVNSQKFISKINTSFGSREFVVSKQKLNEAAQAAMRNMRND
jgi:hypothetical protein